MITDPSWLYSTIAQSSAAIVAIVGGFITASVLMLTAEKKSLVKQLSDKRKMLDSLKKNRLDVITVNMKEQEDEIPILEARIKAFSYPPNLWLGLVILVCFAFGSIILPVQVIMSQAFSATMGQVVFFLFLAGLVAVFSYIGLQFRNLRRK